VTVGAAIAGEQRYNKHVTELERQGAQAVDYFRRLGHDNHHRFFQAYEWEEKKTKTPGGANAMDHEKLAEIRISAMTTADLNRFLVMCSVVPDLYCPGYSSAKALSREANLMQTARRYKVDASEITSRVTAELPKKKGGTSRRHSSCVHRKLGKNAA
jgi:hypothetical protein